MKILKKLNKIRILIAFVILLTFLFFGFKFIKDDTKSKGDLTPSQNDSEWTTYTNKEYGFSIEFPSDWKISENLHKKDLNAENSGTVDLKRRSPVLNIYLPQKNINPPFDHFAEVNNVSIFPEGLQTEAVIGESQRTELDFNFKSDKAIDYILDDGSVWATYISFDGLSDPWKPWGFIWSKTIVENLEYKCISSNVEIPVDNCNPFEGDIFVRAGQVNKEIRDIQEKIIKSLKFIEND